MFNVTGELLDSNCRYVFVEVLSDKIQCQAVKNYNVTYSSKHSPKSDPWKYDKSKIENSGHLENYVKMVEVKRLFSIHHVDECH